MFESRIIGTGVSMVVCTSLTLMKLFVFQIESDNHLSPYVLWCRRLGHLSQDRIESLMKDDTLPSLLNTYESCVDSMKGRNQNQDE